MNTEPGEWLIWIWGIVVGLALYAILRSVGRYFKRTEDLDGDYRGELPPAAAPTQEEKWEGGGVILKKDYSTTFPYALCNDDRGWMVMIGGRLVPEEYQNKCIILSGLKYTWDIKNYGSNILCIPTRKVINKEEE